MARSWPSGAKSAVKLRWRELELHRPDRFGVGANYAGQFRRTNDLDCRITKPFDKELKSSDLHDNLVNDNVAARSLRVAIRELGRRRVNVSIIRSPVKRRATNCPLSIFCRYRRLLPIREMQRTGVFGMKGEDPSGVGYSALSASSDVRSTTTLLEDNGR